MHGLTDFETNVLSMLDDGFSKPEIAAELDCSPVSVKGVRDRYTVNIRAEQRAEERIRSQSRELRSRLIAAGGHN